MCPHAGWIAGSPAILDLSILAFFPTQLVEAVPECGEARGRLGIAFGEPQQHANPPHALGRLRLRRERPRGSRAAEQSDELAAPDHSITSSASASSLAGTSRPSALAATTLMTSWYLVGISTGKSPGFVPLRMDAT